MIKKYLKFINEAKGIIDENTFLDIIQQFNRILALHEKYYYNDNKIVSDTNLKKELNENFENLRQGNTISKLIDNNWKNLSNEEQNIIRNKIIMTENFYNLINKYEQKYYNNNLITPKDGVDNSFWQITDHLIENWNVLYDNDYITGFSEKDIYSDADISEEEKEQQKQNIIKGLDNTIKGLDNTIKKLDDEEIKDMGISMN